MGVDFTARVCYPHGAVGKSQPNNRKKEENQVDQCGRSTKMGNDIHLRVRAGAVRLGSSF